MQFKKLLVTSFIIASLPLIANAKLDTYNHTKEDSSVRVTSGDLKPCSIQAGLYTPREQNGVPGHLEAKDLQIKSMCLTTKGNTCTADIFNTQNCTGTKIGEAQLDLTTKSVTSIKSTDSRYVFLMEKNGTVLRIKYTA